MQKLIVSSKNGVYIVKFPLFGIIHAYPTRADAYRACELYIKTYEITEWRQL